MVAGWGAGTGDLSPHNEPSVPPSPPPPSSQDVIKDWSLLLLRLPPKSFIRASLKPLTGAGKDSLDPTGTHAPAPDNAFPGHSPLLSKRLHLLGTRHGSPVAHFADVDREHPLEATARMLPSPRSELVRSPGRSSTGAVEEEYSLFEGAETALEKGSSPGGFSKSKALLNRSQTGGRDTRTRQMRRHRSVPAFLEEGEEASSDTNRPTRDHKLGLGLLIGQEEHTGSAQSDPTPVGAPLSRGMRGCASRGPSAPNHGGRMWGRSHTEGRAEAGRGRGRISSVGRNVQVMSHDALQISADGGQLTGAPRSCSELPTTSQEGRHIIRPQRPHPLLIKSPHSDWLDEDEGGFEEGSEDLGPMTAPSRLKQDRGLLAFGPHVLGPSSSDGPMASAGAFRGMSEEMALAVAKRASLRRASASGYERAPQQAPGYASPRKGQGCTSRFKRAETMGCERVPSRGAVDGASPRARQNHSNTRLESNILGCIEVPSPDRIIDHPTSVGGGGALWGCPRGADSTHAAALPRQVSRSASEKTYTRRRQTSLATCGVLRSPDEGHAFPRESLCMGSDCQDQDSAAMNLHPCSLYLPSPTSAPLLSYGPLATPRQQRQLSSKTAGSQPVGAAGCPDSSSQFNSTRSWSGASDIVSIPRRPPQLSNRSFTGGQGGGNTESSPPGSQHCALASPWRRALHRSSTEATERRQRVAQNCSQDGGPHSGSCTDTRLRGEGRMSERHVAHRSRAGPTDRILTKAGTVSSGVLERWPHQQDVALSSPTSRATATSLVAKKPRGRLPSAQQAHAQSHVLAPLHAGSETREREKAAVEIDEEEVLFQGPSSAAGAGEASSQGGAARREGSVRGGNGNRRQSVREEEIHSSRNARSAQEGGGPGAQWSRSIPELRQLLLGCRQGSLSASCQVKDQVSCGEKGSQAPSSSMRRESQHDGQALRHAETGSGLEDESNGGETLDKKGQSCDNALCAEGGMGKPLRCSLKGLLVPVP